MIARLNYGILADTRTIGGVGWRSVYNETLDIGVTKMKLAEKTKQLIESYCPDCFSLYAGYGMTNGEYIRFPDGVQLSETRNDQGRCISSVYQYADGSRLAYRFRPGIGKYTLKASV